MPTAAWVRRSRGAAGSADRGRELPDLQRLVQAGAGLLLEGKDQRIVVVEVATTAFIQAGQPASPAAWDACIRALAPERVPLPAP